MSADVIAPNTSSNAVPVALVAPASPDALFTAFREGKSSRLPWVVAAAATLGLCVAGWVVARQAEQTFRVITPRGIITVSHGMSPQEVVGVLGPALTLERDGAAECYRYGQPTLVQESFLVYSVCYEGGKLSNVLQRKYAAWQVDPSTGTFQAPGTEPAAESAGGSR